METFIIKAKPERKSERPYLKGPSTRQQIRKVGYSFTANIEEAWPFPNRKQAEIKCRILRLHMSHPFKDEAKADFFDVIEKPQQFYVVSIQHTHRSEPYITFWRPDFAGYAWPLSWAGKYTEKDDAAHPMYLHRGDDTIMVRAEVVDSLAVAPKRGRIDRNSGPVVPNTARSWKAILGAMLRTPRHTPRPQYRGAPKT